MDTDASGYVGENVFLDASSSGDVHVPAPLHAGHYALKIEMSGTFPPGRIVSCSGLAKCSAQGGGGVS